MDIYTDIESYTYRQHVVSGFFILPLSFTKPYVHSFSCSSKLAISCTERNFCESELDKFSCRAKI